MLNLFASKEKQRGKSIDSWFPRREEKALVPSNKDIYTKEGAILAWESQLGVSIPVSNHCVPARENGPCPSCQDLQRGSTI